MGEGIASDMLALLVQLIQGGRGISARYQTSAAAGTLNVNQKILPDTRYILPAFTIINNGTATINFGWVNATVPLLVGQSYTFRWKNPRAFGGLVFNDLGTAAIVDVIS